MEIVNGIKNVKFVDEERVNIDLEHIRDIKHKYTDKQYEESINIWGYVPRFTLTDLWEQFAIIEANANLEHKVNRKNGCFYTRGISKLENGAFIQIECIAPIFVLSLVSPEYVTKLIKHYKKDYLLEVFQLKDINLRDDCEFDEDISANVSEAWFFFWSGEEID